MGKSDATGLPHYYYFKEVISMAAMNDLNGKI
jgi:hypothetical protein